MSIRARDIIGRTITAVDLQGRWVGNGYSRQWLTDPIITLDNGRKLSFTVIEQANGGEYGIEPSLTKKIDIRRAANRDVL